MLFLLFIKYCNYDIPARFRGLPIRLPNVPFRGNQTTFEMMRGGDKSPSFDKCR